MIQPAADPSEGRITGGDSLNHRDVDIGIGVHDRPPIDRAEALHHEEGTAPVAVRQWMVSREVFD